MSGFTAKLIDSPCRCSFDPLQYHPKWDIPPIANQWIQYEMHVIGHYNGCKQYEMTTISAFDLFENKIPTLVFK